jgi:HK97 family phage major capsid protein
MNITMSTSKTVADLSPREKNSYNLGAGLLAEADVQAGLMASTSTAYDAAARQASAMRQGFQVPTEERVERPTSKSPRTLVHEVSNALKAEFPNRNKFGGLLIPYALLNPKMSGLDTKTSANGAYSVGEHVNSLLEALMVQSTVLQLGASLITGLRGDELFAIEDSGSTGAWVSENPGSDVTESDSTFGQKKMTPKAYCSATSFSRQLLAQSSVGIDSYIYRRLTRAFADALNLAAINGPGVSNEPLGLLRTAGINIVAVGANGGAVAASHLTEAERVYAASNAPENGASWLTSPIMRQRLRAVPTFTNSTEACWRDGRLLDVPAAVSSHVPDDLVKGSSSDCSAVIKGYWPSLIIGEFGDGVVELIVDPYTKKRTGQIEVAAYSLVDILCTRPSAFACIVDARA